MRRLKRAGHSSKTWVAKTMSTRRALRRTHQKQQHRRRRSMATPSKIAFVSHLSFVSLVFWSACPFCSLYHIFLMCFSCYCRIYQNLILHLPRLCMLYVMCIIVIIMCTQLLFLNRCQLMMLVQHASQSILYIRSGPARRQTGNSDTPPARP